MSRLDRYYRLILRNAADTADAVVISSYPGDANCFTVEPPSGDGPSFDPLKGSLVTGSYTYRVIDNGTTANAITPELADADARQQLLSRKALVKISPDGSTWTSLGFGYVNAVRMPRGNEFEFAIGDTQRKEVSTDIFKYATPGFPKTTAIIGGPIIGGFGSIRDYGGWGYRVADVNGFGYVQLDVISGRIFDPRKANVGSEFRNLSTVSTALADYTNAVARPYFEHSDQWIGATIHGSFPGLEARVQERDGTIVGYFTPLARRTNVTLGYWFGKAVGVDLLIRNGTPSLYLDQNGLDADGVTPLVWNPGIGDEYDIYIYIKQISQDNPLHYAGHPVDLWKAIRDEAGIPYYNTAGYLNTIKALVGDDVRLELRIIESSKIGAFDERVIYGPFGLSTRMLDGARQLFSSRQKAAAVPVATLGLTNLRDPGRPFDLDESTAIKRVVLKQIRLTPWSTAEQDQPPVDGIIALPSTISIDNADTDNTTANAGEVTYDIPGQISTLRSRLKGAHILSWLSGVADEIFDRWGRGIIGGEFQCLHNVTALIGQELLANLPHMPVNNARGGNRIIQIVGRTETPSGPNIKWLDAGSSSAPGVVPTFTLAANATDGRKFVDVAITNGGAITAISGRIRVWVATGAGPASGSGSLTVLIDPAVDDLTFTLPGFDAGTHVWVQMQTVVTGQRPGALSAFQSVNLTDLTPPTSLAVSAQDAGDPSKRMLTWVVGTNGADIPVEVALRLTAETTAANRVVAVLPPGSTQYELTGLDAANRTASVRHIESPPYAGASSYATVAVNTSGAAATLDPPTDPRAFSMADGTFGMDVIAVEFPSEVEFQVKLGAGAFDTAAILTSVAGGRTVYTDFATNDGITRTLRARHVSTGYTASAWTLEVTVEPWTDQPPPEDPDGYVPVAVGGDLVYSDNGDLILVPFYA